ncbi:MAG: YcxB family protein [Pirellulales bacterium]
MADDINPYRAAPVVPVSEPDAAAVGSPMSVAFSLEIDDVIAFHWHHYLVSPVVARGRRVSRLVGCLFLALGAACFWFDGLLVLAGAIAMGGVGLLSLGSRRNVRRSLATTFQRHYADDANRRLLGPRQVWLDPDGVRHRSELAEAFWKWPAIHKIDQAAEHAIVYIGTNEGLAIPQRAFGSQAHFEAFIATARRFHEQALALPTFMR